MRKDKIITPIIITIAVILYYLVYFSLLISMFEGMTKYILGILPIALSILMIKVCLERIEEIKKGENDDISKY